MLGCDISTRCNGASAFFAFACLRFGRGAGAGAASGVEALSARTSS